MIISPPAAAIIQRYVAPTILSGIIVYSQPWSLGLPFIMILLSPSPEISAPQALRKPQRSHISGSRAALFITVSPSAVTAHRIIFSVAPTDGNGSDILAPCALTGLRQVILPKLSLISTPIFLSAARCISIGLGPSSHPPGQHTVHSPVLPSRAPRKMIDERISRISSSGIEVSLTPAADITAVFPENVHLHPTQFSILDAAKTSVSLGQFLRIHSSPLRIAAAIIGSALFLLP